MHSGRIRAIVADGCAGAYVSQAGFPRIIEESI